jgi:putative ABC transport system permease protein
MKRGWVDRLIEALLPHEVAEEVLGDLWEERMQEPDGLAARVRYVVRALAVVTRFAWAGRWRLALAGDLRVSVRKLRRDPTFTIVAVGAFALGVGANVLMLSIAEAVLFAPLPYPEPDRLAVISNDHSGSDTGGFGVSWDNTRDLLQRTHAVESVALYLDWRDISLQGERGAFQIAGAFVSNEYIELLDLQPSLGRFIRPDENQVNAPGSVVVLGYGTWRDVFGADPRVLGRSVLLNGHPYEVIGVAADDRGDLRYRWGLDPVGIYLPLFAAEQLADFQFVGNRGGRYFNAVARLDDGVSVQSAQEELAGLARELALEFPETNQGWRYRIQALDEALFEAVRAPTVALVAVSGLVFLLVVVNLLTLTLLRSAGRQGEIAMRQALGAGPSRIARQLLTENLVLFLVGGAVGLALGHVGLLAFRAQDAVRLPAYAEVGLDARIILITAAAALALAAILALGPAMGLLRGTQSATLHGVSRGSTGSAGMRVRGALVAGEVALALVLLVAAGLLTQSYASLRDTGYGFDTERLFLARVDVSGSEYGAEEQRIFARELAARGSSLPGVESAFIWAPNRLGHGNQVDLLAGENRWDTHPEERIEASQHAVHPGTLEALGIERVAGRDVGPSDAVGTPRVALVSEALASSLWPGEAAVGRRMEARDGEGVQVIEVIGVVADARHRTRLVNAFGRQLDVYYPFVQRPWPYLTLALRYQAGTSVAELASATREIVREMEPAAPVHGVTTMAEWMRDEEATARIGARLVGAYAVLAVALAALGLYGVLAHNVKLQLREIGIRMALGADRGRVLRHVLGQGLAIVVIGVVGGAAAAGALGPRLAVALYDAEPNTVGVLLSVTLVISITALVACGLPALRAIRLDPAAVLQAE